VSEFGESYRQARRVLASACVDIGILASPSEEANYARVWARDSVICGLAGLVADDAVVIDGLERSLATLRDRQGPHGEIPSNAAADAVSYGGLTGRVDAPIWYVIGCVCLAKKRPETLASHESAIRKALWLLGAWETNLRGLVSAPLGGAWADEYPQEGFVLSVQLLRMWALRALGTRSPKARQQAAELEQRIETNYWLSTPGGGDYHPGAYDAELARSGPSRYWVGSFSPGGYSSAFDGFGNALALFLDLPNRTETLESFRRIAAETGSDLVPAFWPPIGPGDPGWESLANYHAFGFRNQPGEFHNGGLWPMLTGWAAAGLALADERELASQMARAIDIANSAGEAGFYEYHSSRDLEPSGIRHTTWSAAGAVIARHAIDDPERVRAALLVRP
jgi:hypothetical protein